MPQSCHCNTPRVVLSFGHGDAVSGARAGHRAAHCQERPGRGVAAPFTPSAGVRAPKAAGDLQPWLHRRGRDPLLPRVWELGKRCGGASITPAIRDKVRRLTEEIQQGKMTSAQAVASLRADLAKGA